MSQEDRELMRRMYRAWNDGDMDALADVFDADVEVRPALSAFLAGTVYRGHDGVAAWYAETYEPWAKLRAEPRRFVDATSAPLSSSLCTPGCPGARWTWTRRSRMWSRSATAGSCAWMATRSRRQR
jgi:hypothetical protein